MLYDITLKLDGKPVPVRYCTEVYDRNDVDVFVVDIKVGEHWIALCEIASNLVIDDLQRQLEAALPRRLAA